jgi:hypothetical protein
VLLAVVTEGIASGRLWLESEADLAALYQWLERLRSALETRPDRGYQGGE